METDITNVAISGYTPIPLATPPQDLPQGDTGSTGSTPPPPPESDSIIDFYA